MIKLFKKKCKHPQQYRGYLGKVSENKHGYKCRKCGVSLTIEYTLEKCSKDDKNG